MTPYAQQLYHRATWVALFVVCAAALVVLIAGWVK